jgi:hypothetical protein
MIELRVRLSDDDYADVFRRVLRQGPLLEVLRWVRLAAMLPVALGVLAAVRGRTGDALWYAPQAAATLALGIGAPWLAERVYRWSLTRKPHRNELSEVVVSDDGVHARSAHDEERMTWRSVDRVVAYPDGWLLQAGTRMQWLPVSALVDPEAGPAVDQLLRRKVSNLVRG